MLPSIFASGSSSGPSARFGRRCRRLALGLVALPLMTAPALASPATAGSPEALQLANPPLADDELAGLRGGFSIGGFDLSVGIVSRSVLGQTDGMGERLEVVSRYSVPGVGRLAHDGTIVQTVPAAGGNGPAAGTQPPAGLVVANLGTGATVDLGGTTRLTHRLLDALVENSGVNRAITRQLDINLEVGGLARRIDASRAARSLRPAVEAQILYGRR